MENIKIDDFLKYKFLSNIKLSKDGKHACFAVYGSNFEENSYLSDLWLYNTEEDKYFKLTSSGQESSFIWLDDSENILFSSARCKKDKEKKEKGEVFTKYYKINIHGGEAEEAFSIPLDVTSIQQMDDKTFLVTANYNSMKKDLSGLNANDKEEELKKSKEENDYEVLDEIPFWSNGDGFVNKKRNRLYIYHADTNKMEALTDEYTNVGQVHLSSDRKKAVLVSVRYTDKMPINDEINIIDLTSGKTQKVLKNEVLSCSYADFMSDDTIMIAASDMQKYGVNENHKFYIYSISDEKKKCLTYDKDFSLWDSVGSDCRYGESETIKKDGKYVYFITTEFHSSYLNRLDAEGNIERIAHENGSVDSYDVVNGKVLVIAMWNMKLQELYKLESGKYIQVTYFNDWVHKERKISLPEKMNVQTTPNMLIEGWVMKPTDFEKGKKYPAILDVHGGPKTVYGEVFFHEMQYWASHGYAVIFCNPRGGDGRGNEFADLRGKYGTIDYDDIMKFTDEAVSKYDFIDKDRLGVTGGSYGGFMTNWIIGHTNRFKAAASQRSISNWVSDFCATDIGYYFADDQNLGNPWDNPEKLWEHSPLKYADKVKTPTLFINSNEDYRCWMAEGLQMFTALKYHGVEARLCLFKGENHELSRSGKPKHRLRRLSEITKWFDSHLK